MSKRLSKLSWGKGLVLACIAGGAAGTSAFWGLGTVIGVGALSFACVFSFFVCLSYIPKLGRTKIELRPQEQASDGFLQKIVVGPTVDQLHEHLQHALRQSGQGREAYLFVPDSDQGLRLVSSQQRQASDQDQVMLAHEWLQGSPLVVMKNDVDRVDEPGAEALSDLMSEFDCDIMFPLSYHGRPLGLALVQGETKSDPSLHFYGSLNRHLASGLAFALLNEREHGMDGQSEVLVQAKDTQRSLMPAENVVRRQHFELRGVFRPADECGGDLWVWKELPDNKLLIVIADATGHGAGPALISSVAKGAIDAYLHESMRDASPDKLLSALNRAIYRVGRRFFMMTAFATVVDLNNGNMVYANAAQTFPYVFSDGKVGALVARGNSLGAAMDVEFTLYERTLSKGDQMLFVTDGVVEAGAAVDKEFGERRFRSLLAQLRGTRAVKMPDVVLSTVRQHLGKSPVGDDITIVAFSYGQVGDVGKALQT